jgi:hypothetical protein
MGEFLAFFPEKLVAGLLLAREIRAADVFARLEEVWGRIDHLSPASDFPFTDYYAGEMGGGLRRYYLSFETLQDPGLLADFKLKSNSIEEEWRAAPDSPGGGEAGPPRTAEKPPGRRINLDPGLLTLGHLILASTKPADHRVALSRGVYAELTLVYRRGTFEPLPWTYPDFRAPAAVTALSAMRAIYKTQRRQLLGEAGCRTF